MTEEEKLKMGERLRLAFEKAKADRAEMSNEELDEITDEGLCAAPLEEQE